MIREVTDFKRKELFDHYHSCDNPFAIVTTKIDVTNVVNYCKKYKNFYATLGFLITKTVNQIDNFKYRYKDEKIYYCDIVNSNYTQMYDDGKIGYFSIPINNAYNEYIKDFLQIEKKFMEDKNYSAESNLDEIWLSCEPWFSFSGLIPPFSKSVSIPQFIWNRYEKVDDKYYVNLMIMIHHGFADGYHIGEFINLLQKNIDLFV